MKTKTILLVILFTISNFLCSQVSQDSLRVNNIYAPNTYNNSFSAEQSWEMHKAAYIKQLTAKGFTADEIKSSLLTYEKDKEKFILRVKEEHRLAAIQRKKASKQRALAAIQRKKASKQRALAAIQRQKASKQRALAAIQRQKADELRKFAEITRKEAEKQRGESKKQREKANKLIEQANIEREKANELIEQADIEREKANELIEQANIEREKAEELREEAQEWMENSENILIKNITLTKQSENNKRITFKVTSKKTLRIGVRANISSGTTLIEIYNPKGIKECELSLNLKSKRSNQKGKRVGYTFGTFDKTISSTEIGEWQIKIVSKNSEGSVVMSVAQYINPTIDE